MPIYRKGDNQFELFKRAQLQDKQKIAEIERSKRITDDAINASRRFVKAIEETHGRPLPEHMEDFLDNTKPLLDNSEDLLELVNRETSYKIGSGELKKDGMDLNVEDVKEAMVRPLTIGMGELLGTGHENYLIGDESDEGLPISGDDLALGKHEKNLFNKLGYN